MKTITLVLLSASLAASACKKDAADATPGSPATGSTATKPTDKPAAPAGDDPLAAVPSNLPAPFAAWDLPARAKAWQGAWVSEQSLGFAQATEIKGANAKTWDGKAEKTLVFALESPCSATFTEKSSDGSSQSTTTHFTVKDGKLIEGLGDAGTRKGKAAIACVSDKILALDDAGACVAWTNDFGHWASGPSTCALAQKDGKDVFTAKVNGADYELLVDGDALMSDQLAHKSSAAYPDFAAAKAARDKK